MEVTHRKPRFRCARSIAALLAVAAMLASVPVASAQTVSPTDDQYDSSLELITEGGRGPGQQAAPSAVQPGGGQPGGGQPGGGLPFTGLDVAGLLAAAAALGGSGLLLRHLARRRSPSGGPVS